MLEDRPGPDPYIFYKMHHVERARAAWVLSEEFGLYEAVRDGPTSVEETAQRIGLRPRPTAILLSANACMGILAVADGRYSIYPVMREFVLQDGRARMAPRSPDPDDFWCKYTRQAMLQDGPVPEVMPPWLSDPEGLKSDTEAHNAHRHGWRMLWGEALAEAFDFSPYRLVLDVGGSTGGVLVGLTGKYPDLQGTVMDLPYARASADAAIEESGAIGRVTFHSGDFFEDAYPAGVDIIFMSHIIHDWHDEACLKLLGRCFDALPAGSPVLIQEFLLDEEKRGQLLGVFQWFGLVFGTTGDQRTAGEIGALLERSGFADIESRPIDAEQSIVIAWKR